MWNNFHNLRHAVSKCIKQCKQRTKTLGNIWGIMGLYGRVWESQAKQKNKNIYTSLKGYEEGLEAMLSKMFFTYLQAPTESLCRPRDIMIYHDGFVGTFWYILIYSKNIPSKLTSDIHWQSIYIESKSIYTSYHGFASSRGIESILFISNPTQPDAPFLSIFCTPLPRSRHLRNLTGWPAIVSYRLTTLGCTEPFHNMIQYRCNDTSWSYKYLA